jgi:hypothetical protein
LTVLYNQENEDDIAVLPAQREGVPLNGESPGSGVAAVRFPSMAERRIDRERLIKAYPNGFSRSTIIAVCYFA